MNPLGAASQAGYKAKWNAGADDESKGTAAYKATWKGGVEDESNATEYSLSFRATHACGFTTDVDVIEGVLGTFARGPILKLARVLGAFRRFFACSRIRIQRSSSVAEAQVMLRKSLSITEGRKEKGSNSGQLQPRDLECMKLELLAVLRHLEVRWQLFNEAMAKWCDLEAMLAICTHNVTWSGGSGVIITGRDSPLLSENLRSLLNKNLSFHVAIENITRLSPKVFPDMSLDKDGNCVELGDSELRSAAASLDKLLGSRKYNVFNEESWFKDPGPYMVLEKDRYILQDAQGKIVERGTRTVLWKQQNSTWYIRACIVDPSKEKFDLL